MRAVPVAGGPLPTTDLKQLFRDAAKRMHPTWSATRRAARTPRRS
jgi:hypothetical protein